ncbi:NUDIX domain-containing protein [Candidatus Gottesmanbacteria bacterium]|nr:NUDIX domain-containing protein [Candidatus Gottesmanbacteria bacterium]
MERFKMIASGFLMLIKNGNILLIRRANTGYHDGYYSLPAGHVEENESVRKSTVRESFEEIGIRVNQKDLLFVHALHNKENDIRLFLFFRAKRWKGKPYNKEPDKCDDLQWFPLKKLPTNTVGYIRQAIACYRTKVLYSEFGWE